MLFQTVIFLTYNVFGTFLLRFSSHCLTNFPFFYPFRLRILLLFSPFLAIFQPCVDQIRASVLFFLKMIS